MTVIIVMDLIGPVKDTIDQWTTSNQYFSIARGALALILKQRVARREAHCDPIDSAILSARVLSNHPSI